MTPPIFAVYIALVRGSHIVDADLRDRPKPALHHDYT